MIDLKTKKKYAGKIISKNSLNKGNQKEKVLFLFLLFCFFHKNNFFSAFSLISISSSNHQPSSTFQFQFFIQFLFLFIFFFRNFSFIPSFHHFSIHSHPTPPHPPNSPTTTHPPPLPPPPPSIHPSTHPRRS